MDTTGSTCTIAAAGDAIVTRRLMPYAESNGRIDELRTVIDATDAAVANLEVVFPERDASATPLPPVPSQYQYLSPLAGILMRAEPFVLDELAEFGFDLFATGSNHSFDYGREGMRSTMNALRERDLPFAGMGETLADARRPGYVDTPGGRIGLVAANTSIAPGSEAGPASPAHPGRTGINPLHLRWIHGATAEQLHRLRELRADLGLDELHETWLVREDPDWEDRPYEPFMHAFFEAVDDGGTDGPTVRFEPLTADRRAYLDSVAAAAAKSDHAIASLHSHQAPGGVRNTAETPAFLRSFARDCIDAGADLFVGTGPHVLRGMEIYRGRPIFYSLGNLAYQTETIERLPAESYDYYGVDDATDPAALFRSRYRDEDGEPAGSLDRDEYWETVVPVCAFEGDDLASVRLYPCSLGQDRALPRRGTPALATGDHAEAILARLAALSEPFETEIGVDDGVGVIEL
ncbi:CapA family protein [Halorubrum sp. DTA98]|uniref:CapA family protein n=1 Tax=Halorubrum sp. DTA98 TaxID=3402163 RepID=UPI003AAD8301